MLRPLTDAELRACRRTTINPTVRYRNARITTKLAERLYQWLAKGGMVVIPGAH